LLSYDAVGLPDGLHLDPDTGLVSGTPAEDPIQSTPYSVTETATDGSGNSASQSFNWTVADSVLTMQGNTLSSTEGAGAIFTVATFYDSDLNRQATDYTATISWGDGQTSQGWVDAVNGVAGSYTVSGDHAYLHPASLPVQVTVTDPAGGSETVVETASVAEVALTATGGFQEGEVNGLSPTLTVATFADLNTYDTFDTYTATID
jgi:large repetitive protein